MPVQSLLDPILNLWPNRGLIPWITKHTAPLLSQDAWQTAAGHLAELNQSTDRKSAANAHVAALEKPFAR